MATKICMGDYVPDIYRNAKFHYDPITAFWPHICEIAYRLLFWVLTTRYPQGYWPILTMPKDVVSHKNVPFGGGEGTETTFTF